MGGREEFLQIWQQHITRPGSEKLLDWLDKNVDAEYKKSLTEGNSRRILEDGAVR